MRIAIYARVSTDDKGQDPENQLRQLRQWCASAGHELVHEYVDHESGRKGRTASNSLRCLRMRTNASLIASYSGRSTALARCRWPDAARYSYEIQRHGKLGAAGA
jgi:predicted site-specific integrase-resolvase